MENILSEISRMHEKIKDAGLKPRTIHIVISDAGFHTLVNGTALAHYGETKTIDHARSLLWAEVDRLCTVDDALARTLGIEVAA